jgi:rhamnogalacturonyl hydrolase YesR
MMNPPAPLFQKALSSLAACVIGTVSQLPAAPTGDQVLTDMMRALLKLQNADGLWRTSLLDPEDPVGQSSGSAFFTYAPAWGVNRGLPKDGEFRQATLRGWSALATPSFAVHQSPVPATPPPAATEAAANS